MKWLDLTFPTPEQNLACDEALLESVESGAGEETLRFWEPAQPFLVLGHSNRVAREVDALACARLGIPMLRRCSGGGAVFQGPGCLNYALVLGLDTQPALASVTRTNAFIMGRHRDALSTLLSEPVQVEGVTDLTIAGRKFSGNAQRRRRRCLLFHGTFLLNLDLELLNQVLQLPSRAPAYRQERTHQDFLRNLQVTANVVKEALRACWQAMLPLTTAPLQRIEDLARWKYSAPAWTRKF